MSFAKKALIISSLLAFELAFPLLPLIVSMLPARRSPPRSISAGSQNLLRLVVLGELPGRWIRFRS